MEFTSSITLFFVLVIYFAASVRLAIKADKLQRDNYQKLSKSLRERGMLDSFEGPDYLRPQWEIRLAEIEPSSNYNKIAKHLQRNIDVNSLTAIETEYLRNIKQANSSFVPLYSTMIFFVMFIVLHSC